MEQGKASKTGRSPFLLALLFPFLLGNSPAPGPYRHYLDDPKFEIVDHAGGKAVSLRNDTKKYIVALDYQVKEEDGDYERKVDERLHFELGGRFDNAPYLFIPPEKAAITSLPVGEENGNHVIAANVDSIYVMALEAESIELLEGVVLESKIDSAPDGTYKVTIRGKIENPSHESIAYAYGAYAVSEEGLYCYLTDEEDLPMDSSVSFRVQSSIPPELIDCVFHPIIVYDNEYYSRNWPGDPASPLAIVSYVLLGIFAVSAVSVGAYLLVKKKKKA